MSLFELLGVLLAAVAVLGYLNYRFVHLPDTIGITAMGLVASLMLAVAGSRHPAAIDWASSVADRIDLPQIVLHGLLSVLLFAGSLHIDLAELARQRAPVFVMATLGVALSVAIVGFGTHWLCRALGIDIALSYCLAFGALISPTDPIAVLSILKSAGVPKELEMTISGESLFNDGTAVVAFIALLGIATGTEEVSAGSLAILLAQEVLGAALLGLAVGYAAFAMLKGVDSYPVEILITLAAAIGGYGLAERLHASAPLVVVVIGLVIGNHGAARAMSARTREHLFSFWSLLDDVLNLVLFGLIGLKMLSLADQDIAWPAASLLIPLVLAARGLSVALLIGALGRWLQPAPHTIELLTWGGLRGGISVALALSLPGFPGREFLVAATYAVVLFSLLVQASTLGLLLKRLHSAG